MIDSMQKQKSKIFQAEEHRMQDSSHVEVKLQMLRLPSQHKCHESGQKTAGTHQGRAQLWLALKKEGCLHQNGLPAACWGIL